LGKRKTLVSDVLGDMGFGARFVDHLGVRLISIPPEGDTAVGLDDAQPAVREFGVVTATALLR